MDCTIPIIDLDMLEIGSRHCETNIALKVFKLNHDIHKLSKLLCALSVSKMLLLLT